MPIVSNAGPILSFARAGNLGLLHQVVAELLIPGAVAEELGQTLTAGAPWIMRGSVRDHRLVDSLPQRLHLGEREAIVPAIELGATLLIDDREARRDALQRELPHFGSLRVLKRAKERGFIPRIRPVLDELIASGTYISKSLYQEFLREVREE